MLIMKVQVDVVCCKSVGTDLSMLDIEDFITEICQLKKEVASLEAKLRERGEVSTAQQFINHWVKMYLLISNRVPQVNSWLQCQIQWLYRVFFTLRIQSGASEISPQSISLSRDPETHRTQSSVLVCSVILKLRRACVTVMDPLTKTQQSRWSLTVTLENNCRRRWRRAPSNCWTAGIQRRRGKKPLRRKYKVTMIMMTMMMMMRTLIPRVCFFL